MDFTARDMPPPHPDILDSWEFPVQSFPAKPKASVRTVPFTIDSGQTLADVVRAYTLNEVSVTQGDLATAAENLGLSLRPFIEIKSKKTPTAKTPA